MNFVRVLTLLMGMCAVQAAHASPETQERFQELAKRILETTKNESLTIGIFSQTDLPNSNAGPGLEELLATELNRVLPGCVREDAKFVIKGDYAFAKSREPERGALKVIKVNIRIIDKEFAEDLLTIPFSVTFDQTRTLAEILQITAALPPDGSKEKRNQQIDEVQSQPTVAIHGPQETLVSSSTNSQFAVELLVQPLKDATPHGAAPRPARSDHGFAFVNIQQTELYEVKLYNNSHEEIAASLSIDGLDVFHFSKDRNAEGRPRFTHFILAPHSSQTIVGWHNSSFGQENFLSFLVTAYGRGAVSKAGIQARGQVGVIHVQFSKCHVLHEGQSSRGGNETGFGPPREIQQKVVRYEIEPPHDFVSIRYTRPQ